MKTKEILILVGLVILVAGAYFIFFAGEQQPPASQQVAPESTTTLQESTGTPPASEEGTTTEQVRTIAVEGDEYSFSPASLTLQKGEPVQVQFENVGDISHNFVIPQIDTATDVIDPGATDTIQFTAPETGVYTFICSLPGHEEAGMKGELHVE